MTDPTTSPPPASIALANGVVVRVGDVVHTLDGAAMRTVLIHKTGIYAEPVNGKAHYYGLDGKCECCPGSTALALASPPAARQRSGVEEVVDAARELIGELDKPFAADVDNMDGTNKAIQRTRQALAALDQEARDGE